MRPGRWWNSRVSRAYGMGAEPPPVGEQLESGAGEDLEGDHGGRRLPGRPKNFAPFAS